MGDRSITHIARKMHEVDYEVGKPNLPPRLYHLDDYTRWSERFLDYLRYTDWKMYMCIENAYVRPVTSTSAPMSFSVMSEPQKLAFELDQKTLSTLRSCLPQDLYYVFKGITSAKELWDAVKKSVVGNPRILEQRKEMVKKQFVVFRHFDDEKTDELISRYYHLLTTLEGLDIVYTETEKVAKFLEALPKKWGSLRMMLKHDQVKYAALKLDEVVEQIRSSDFEERTTELSYSEVQDPALYHARATSSGKTISGSGVNKALRVETELERIESEEGCFVPSSQVVKTVSSSTSSHAMSGMPMSVKSAEDQLGLLSAFMSSYGNLIQGKIEDPAILDEDYDQVDPDDLEEMELQFHLALITRRVKKFMERTGRRLEGGRAGIDKTRVRCFNCQGLGHFARECQRPRVERNTNQGFVRQSYPSQASDSRNQSSHNYGFENKRSSQAMVAVTTEAFDRCPLRLAGHALIASACVDDISESKEEITWTDRDLTSESENVIASIDREISSGDDLSESKETITWTDRDLKSESENVTVSIDREISSKLVDCDCVLERLDVECLVTMNEQEFMSFMANLQSDNQREQVIKAINQWVIDSGCSNHMTGERSILENFVEGMRGKVSFAGEFGGKITGIGEVTNGEITLEKVNYVKELEYNLLSVSQICDQKKTVFFNNTECLILKPGFTIPEEWILASAPRLGNLYMLNMSEARSSAGPVCLVSKASESDSLLWHRRMGHIHSRKMNEIIRLDLVEGVPKLRFEFEDKCVSCKKGK